jgi:hypothetical protein
LDLALKAGTQVWKRIRQIPAYYNTHFSRSPSRRRVRHGHHHLRTALRTDVELWLPPDLTHRFEVFGNRELISGKPRSAKAQDRTTRLHLLTIFASLLFCRHPKTRR